MRKGIIYAALLAGALMLRPVDAELGKMKPVETLSIQYSNGVITLTTDTEDTGSGSTVAEAVQDLQEAAAGRVYLDTTAYLLVGENASSYIEDLAPYIKASTRMCEMGAGIAPKDVGEYLRSHEPETKVKQWQEGVPMQILVYENDHLKLCRKNAKKCLTNATAYDSMPKLPARAAKQNNIEKKFGKT